MMSRSETNVPTQSYNYLYPYRLVFIECDKCDFCKKKTETYTYYMNINDRLGWQYCELCNDKLLKSINNYCTKENIILWNELFKYLNIEKSIFQEKKFKIERSTKEIEEWYIDLDRKIRYNDTDWYIPIVNGDLVKYIKLKNFKKLNNCDISKKIIIFIENININ